jgi:type I restriction enzyme M protein
MPRISVTADGRTLYEMGPVKRYFRTMPARRNSPETRGSPVGLGSTVKRRLAGDIPGNKMFGAKHTRVEADRLRRAARKASAANRYFLDQSASAEGKRGGEFYTPQCVDKLLVHMIAPYKGRVYDPCDGSCGLFVQSEKFIEAHGGKLGDIAIFGQESNPTTWKLGVMNLAIRGIEADLGKHAADTFRNDLHPDLKADYVLANFPFNVSDWYRRDDAVRWKWSGATWTTEGCPQGERGGVHQFGLPPKTAMRASTAIIKPESTLRVVSEAKDNNANFAWIQHIIHHLAPDGMAGFVSANGAMSSNQSGEGEIRRAIIEADLVDCMVALPS